MHTTAFGSESPGELIRNLDGNWTFVPFPLPGRVTWTDSLVAALSRADQTLGQMATLGPRVRHPNRLVHLFLRREAELSSRIENTFAGVRTMLLYQDVEGIEDQAPDVREVDNNYHALQFGIDSLATRGLSVALVKEMHQLLLRGVRGGDKQPGRFRTVQAHIGHTRDINEARFVPAPPHAVEPAMDALLRYIVEPDGLPAVVRAAMAHYQFEAIHPFADGNGRIGRALILIMLCNEGALPAALINPSAPLLRERARYYDHLLAVSQRGEWSGWIEFFARGIADEASDALRRLEAAERLRVDYQQRAARPRASKLAAQLVEHLLAEPKITTARAAEVLGVAFATAVKVIQKLVGAGVLREVTGRARNRVYIAHELVDLFAGGTA